MKATKLISSFAVTAIAAAISTSSIASEPVFYGVASLEYYIEDGSENSFFTNNGQEDAELEFNLDTDVVHFEVEMQQKNFEVEEAYFKLGALTIGDFDGTIADDAFDVADQYLEKDYENVSAGNLGVARLGVRYDVSSDLKVALETAEAHDGIGVAFAYGTDIGDLGLELSGGSYLGEDANNVGDEDGGTQFVVGLSYELDSVELEFAYLTGTETKDSVDTDKNFMTLGVTYEVGNLTLALNSNHDLENELDNVDYLVAYEVQDDVTVYLTGNTADDSVVTETTIFGIQAEF